MRSAVIRGIKDILPESSARNISASGSIANVTYHLKGWRKRGVNMFIKESVFKKLAKQAWKNNVLVIINSNEVYHIELKFITLQVRKEFMSNKIKASLIELIGELPAEGEGYKYGEDCEPQKSLCLFDRIDGYDGEECRETCVLIQRSGLLYNVYQTEKTKVMVNNVLVSMVDTSNINEAAGEYAPDAPMLCDGYVIWCNNAMSLKVPVTSGTYTTDRAVLSIESDLVFDGTLID